MSSPAAQAVVQVVSLRSSGPRLNWVERDGSATAVIWPGVGAVKRSIALVILEPEGGTVRLEHARESVYYVLAGSGAVLGDGDNEVTAVAEGSMVHVGIGTGYRFVAGKEGMELFGGPCPPDRSVSTSGLNAPE